MKSEPFEGRSIEMKKSTQWLASEDILGLTPVPVTVEKVYRHKDVKFDAGRTEKEVFSLAFVGKQKQMVLNSINRQTMVAMFGANVKEWAGKAIKLDVVKCKMMGKIVNGIRVVNEAHEEAFES